MDRMIRILAVALCAAAVVCAAAEPEVAWGRQVVEKTDLVARSGPIHSLVAPIRVASEVVSFLETEAEANDVVPENFFMSEDDAGEAPAKKAAASAVKDVVKAVAGATKAAEKKAAAAPKKAAAAPKKAAAAKKPAKATAKAAKKPASPAEKKTEATIKKVKAKIAKQKKGVAKDNSEEKKVVAEAHTKAAIAAGPDDSKVKTLKERAKAGAKSLGLHPAAAAAAKKPVKWSTKNVHLKKNYRGKLHLPEHFKVLDKAQVEKKIDEARPASIHTSEEYWKLKQLRTEYKYKKGYDAMREKLLRKELRRHYASKLTRDHMRRKIDTLRRQRALDEYGPGAHYKPFTWGSYADPKSDKDLKNKVNAHADAKKKQEMIHTAKTDMKKGKVTPVPKGKA